MVVAAAAPSTGDAEAAVKQQPQSNTSLLSQIELEQAHLLSEMEKILGKKDGVFSPTGHDFSVPSCR